MKRRLLAAALLLLAAAAPARAGEFSDLVLKPGILADLPEDAPLRYAHERRLPAAAEERGGAIPLRPLAAGEAALARIGSPQGDRLVLTLTEAGRSREVGRYAASGADPLLLAFLENVVRAVSARTGGSPFYLRNRIRESLVAAEIGEGEAVVLRPFAEDPNRARLGDFADLVLSFRLDPARPERLLELRAEAGAAPEAYLETLRLITEE